LDAIGQLRCVVPPDLIVLDLMMPVMDGWQFRVRQRNDPTIASIPVLAISADDSAKAAAIHADGYLKKPLDLAMLLHAIERILLANERQRLQVQIAQTERMVALGTLAAGVAHEINNPLAYVSANLGLITEKLSVLGSVRPPATDAAALGKAARQRVLDQLAELEDIVRRAREGADEVMGFL